MSLYSAAVIAPNGHIVTLDAFFEGAGSLRRELDVRLSDDRDPFDPSRFAWEAWHIDGQFSQQRTPARTFFSARAFAPFEARLLGWASLALGLSAFGGPPWLSSLTDGCFQALHRDSPNGEFAFSYGLSRPSRGVVFRGGETQIATFDLLDYFRSRAHTSERASSPLFHEIAPRWNRLVAFDARLPHAVRMVEGPRHVRDGRVAIQGWLVPEGCVVRGRDVDRHEATELAADVVRRVARRARGAAGLLSVRVHEKRARVVCDTLVDTGPGAVTASLRGSLTAALAKAPFQKGADVIVPVLVGERGASVPDVRRKTGRATAERHASAS